jgi:hypothetical protein
LATITSLGYINFQEHGRDSEILDWSPTSITIHFPGGSATFRGTDFTFDYAQDWWHGTVTYYAEYDSAGNGVFEIKDFVSPARAFQTEFVNTFAGLLTGNDTIYLLGSSDDVAFAGAGNDVIYSGSKTIDGGEGIDTAVYELSSSNYTVGLGGDVLGVTGGGSDDRLYSIERIAFSDGILAFDQNAYQAYRIYQAAFDRTPDNAGLSYWISQMDGGLNVLDVSARFLGTAEFRDIYGSNPAASAFVSQLYQNILGREGNAEDLQYWVGELESGQRNAAQVLADFSESPENVALVGQVVGPAVWVAATVA